MRRNLYWVWRRVPDRLREDRGADSTEYALITGGAVAVALIVVAAVTDVTDSIVAALRGLVP